MVTPIIHYYQNPYIFWITEPEYMKKGIPIYIDTTSRALSVSKKVREQISNQIKNKLMNEIPEIIKREKNIRALMTDELGDYLMLLREAKEVYKLGYFHSAIAMVGIAVERFSIELESHLRFEINGNPITQKNLIGNHFNQYKRLRLLKKANLITQDAFDKLEKIRVIRNKYVHPKTETHPEKDSIETLNLMITVLKSRFSSKYSIRKGKLVLN